MLKSRQLQVRTLELLAAYNLSYAKLKQSLLFNEVSTCQTKYKLHYYFLHFFKNFFHKTITTFDIYEP